MHKKIRKMTLSRETLHLLDGSAVKEAAGGLVMVAGSMDRTCQSLCIVCPETWPVVTG